jgi:hypothetical protein
MYRIKLIVISSVAALALSATAASSASAFAWWIETEKGKEILLKGKAPFNGTANVTKPVSFTWNKEFTVSCRKVKYDEGFIEGPVALGASSIVLEECAATSPANCNLTNRTIETTALTGEIRQTKAVTSEVEFEFKPKSGTLLTSVTLEGSGCSRREVQFRGAAVGELTKPKELTKEKSFDFESKGKLEVLEKIMEGGEAAHEVEKNEGNSGYSATSGWSAH